MWTVCKQKNIYPSQHSHEESQTTPPESSLPQGDLLPPPEALFCCGMLEEMDQHNESPQHVKSHKKYSSRDTKNIFGLKMPPLWVHQMIINKWLMEDWKN